MSQLCDILHKNLLRIYNERSRAIGVKIAGSGPLFFSNEDYAQAYGDLFGIQEIQEQNRFASAFKIVTGGVGSEDTKINSLVSSSLLSLLTFFPLFDYKSGKPNVKIKIDMIGQFDSYRFQFDSCRFEVRNKVVTIPSCIDVLIRNCNENKWLFLESKFYEPLRDVRSELEIGKTYADLYESIADILEKSKIYVKVKSGKLYIQTYDTEDKNNKKDRKRIYLYGIKQAICHLIGLVRGPITYSRDMQDYPKDYHKGWNVNSKVYFGVVLYDSKINNVKEYRDLFEDIFCKDYREQILDAIYAWVEKKGYDIVTPKENIEIIRPLSYQSILANNALYKENLPKAMKVFYNFD